MDIGQAVVALKSGKLIARAGWNGKGMHLYLEDGYVLTPGTGTERTYAPVVVMFTAQRMHQPGWLCSQADLLAEDWEVVDETLQVPVQKTR